jgi:hypothetical protein
MFLSSTTLLRVKGITLFILWAAIIVALCFQFRGSLPFLVRVARMENYIEGGQKLLLFHLIGFSILVFLVNLPLFLKFDKWKAYFLAGVLFLSVVDVFFMSQFKTMLLQLLALLVWCVTGALGIKWGCKKVLGFDIPFFLAGLILLITIEIILFSFGAFGMARGPIYWILFTGPTVLFLFLVSGEMLSCLREAKKFFEDLNVSDWIWIDGLLVLLFIGAMHSIVPETITDAAELHIPKVMLMIAEGGIRGVLDFPYNPWNFFPSLIHVIYSFGYYFLGELGCKGLTLFFLIILFFSLYDLAKLIGISRSYFLGGVVLFFYIPEYVWHIGSGYVDMPTSVIGVAAISCFARKLVVFSGSEPVSAKQGLFYSFLAGLLIGCGVNAKQTIMVFAASFLVVLGLLQLGGFRGLNKLRSAELAGGVFGFFLIALPHWIVMFALTDNPVYPALNSIFHSPYWREGYAVTPSISQLNDPISLLQMIFLPYTLTWHTSLFTEAVDGSFGIWFLVFSPFILFCLKGNSKSLNLFLLVFSLVYLAIFHILGVNYLRYYFPVVGLFAILLACGLSNFITFFDLKCVFKFKVVSLVIPVFILLFTWIQLRTPTTWSPSLAHWKFFKRGDRNTWYDRFSLEYSDFRAFTATLPEKATILLDGTELASGVMRKPLKSDNAVIKRVSGLKGIHPQEISTLRNPFSLWLQENILGYQRFRKTSKNYGIAMSKNRFWMEDVVKSYSDIYVICSPFTYGALENRKKPFLTADRLMFVAPVASGVHQKFFAAFRMNDDLLAVPEGIFWSEGFLNSRSSLENELPGLQRFQVGQEGNRMFLNNFSNAVAEKNIPLVLKVDVPEESQTLNAVLNLRFINIPDLSADAMILYYDDKGVRLKKYVPGFFSAKNTGVYIVRDSIPSGSHSVEIWLSSSPGKKVGIESYSLFFEKG